MKKKSFIICLFTVFIALFAFACSEVAGYKNTFDPYEGFTGTDETSILTIDDYITLDGVLDEEIWSESKTTVSFEGVQGLDESVWGHREVTIYSYIGDKAIYFAFDVTDPNLYNNPNRPQGGNSTVEIYLTSVDHTTLELGCVSVRVTPTDIGTGVTLKSYMPNSTADDWREAKTRGKTAAAALVDGEMMTRENPDPDMSNNVGYVVEMAIDWHLIADSKPEAIQWTGAFCQSAGWERSRLGNTFMPGTSFTNVASWKLMSNEGFVEDKNAYLDANVKPDEGVTLDGNFTESIWEGTEPRKWVSSYTNKDGENIALEFRTTSTDKGLYVGLESNDSTVFSDEATLSYNTGAELNIAANGTTQINKQNVVQYRFNLDGKSLRYRGNPATKFPYKADYFPAKSGGRVIGGEMNTTTADGWAGEIFIPWTSLGVTTAEAKRSIAILPMMYLANETPEGSAPDGKRRAYAACVPGNIFGENSGGINPQEVWFLFRDGKPVYKSFAIDPVALDASDLVGTGADARYETTISATYSDTVATTNPEVFPKVTGVTFGFDESLGVQVTDNGDGTYKIAIPADKADAFNDISSVPYQIGNEVGNLSVNFDTEFILDGILNEATYASLKKITITNTKESTVSTEFTVAFRANAFYLYVKTTDAKYTSKNATSSLGMEMYFNFGSKLSSSNTYQVRLLSYHKDGYENQFYTYKDSADANGWSWEGGSPNDKIERIFVDNNDGTYTIEARIPYSVFRLDEKPEWVEICPAVKYYGNSGVRTCFFNIEGNDTPSRDHGLYVTFMDEVGYAPDVYAFDASGVEIDSIELTEGVGIVDGKYVGTAKLSYLYDGSYAVTDADFGDYNEYIINNGNGTYTYAIPENAFASSETLEIAYTTALTSGTIDVTLNTLDTIYLLGANGETQIDVWAHEAVTKDEAQYYEIAVQVFGDAECKSAIDKSVMEVTFAIDGIEDIIVENSGSVYTIFVPVEAISKGNYYAINATATDVEGDSIDFKLTELAKEKQEALVNGAIAYFDFNGNIDEKIGGRETYMIYGSAKYDANNGAYLAEQDDRSLNVKNLDVANKNFTVSMLVDGTAMRNTYHNGYGNILFSNTNVDTKIAGRLGVTYRGTRDGGSSPVHMFALYAGTGDPLYANALMTEIDGWTRLTFTYDFSVAGQVKIHLYVNGVRYTTVNKSGAVTDTITVPTDYVVDTNAFGIGGPAKNFDGSGSSAPYNETNNDVAMDDFFVCEGILDVETINALPGYFNFIVAQSAISVADVDFSFADVAEQGNADGGYVADLVIIKYNDLVVTTGATLVNAPAGITLSETAGAYKLNIASTAYASLKDGAEISIKIGMLTKTFTVTYEDFSKVYLAESAIVAGNADVDGNVVNVKIGVFANESKTIPVLSGVTVTLDGNSVDVTSVGDGYYTFTAALDAITADGLNYVVGAGDGIETATLNLKVDLLDDATVEKIVANTAIYMNMDGNFDTYGTEESNAYIRRDRDTSTQFNDNETYNLNMYKRGLTVEGFNVGSRNDHSAEDNWGSFTISMDVNGTDVYNTVHNHYAFIIFGSSNVDKADGFNLMVRGGSNGDGTFRDPTRFYFKIGSTLTTTDATWTKNTYNAFKDGGLQNWTFTFDRTVSGKISIQFYVAGEAVWATPLEVAVADDYNLGGQLGNALGLGAAPAVDDVENYNGKDPDQNKNTDVEVDNFLLYNGILAGDEIRLIANCYDAIMKADYNFKVNDAYVNTTAKTAEVVVTGIDGIALTGATFSDGITVVGEPVIEGNVATYTVSVPDALGDTVGGKEATITLNGKTVTFLLNSQKVDDTVVVDGVMNEAIYANQTAFTYTHVRGSGNAANEVTVSTKTVFGSDGVYVAMDVKDANYIVTTSDNADSGIELNVMMGATPAAQSTKEIRFFADGKIIVYNFNNYAAYEAWTWQQTGEAISIESKTVCTEGVGYVIEAKLPYELFGLTSAPKQIGLQPINYIANANKADRTALISSDTLGNFNGQETGCYMMFDVNGFNPKTVYGIADVTVTEDASLETYTGMTSMLYYGIKSKKDNTKLIRATDLTLVADGVTFTSNKNGTYSFTFAKEAFVAGQDIAVAVKAPNGQQIGTFNIKCVANA